MPHRPHRLTADQAATRLYDTHPTLDQDLYRPCRTDGGTMFRFTGPVGNAPDGVVAWAVTDTGTVTPMRGTVTFAEATRDLG